MQLEFVDSCIGVDAEAYLLGKFDLWEGECIDRGGRPAYFNIAQDVYLYFYSNEWIVGPICGGEQVAQASSDGVYDDPEPYPFLNMPSLWNCVDGSEFGRYLPVSISCTVYDGQPLPCSSGSFDPAGEAPYGICSSSCPSDLPNSPLGSTSIEDCSGECQVVEFESTLFEDVDQFRLNGKYDLWEGECENNRG
jgi:hypothetical protein